MGRRIMKNPQPNPRLTAAIREVVENQLRAQTPPETSQTCQRLLAAGHTADEAKRLIGGVVATESYDVLKHRALFDQVRFVVALHRLPALPWDAQEA
jgi:hypothetical protein